MAPGGPGAARRLGVPLQVHGIGGDGAYEDPEGVWAKAYGTTGGGAVLVRPDGVVAWRASGAPDDAEDVLHAALARMFGR
ncbi:hypothetical protein GTY20_28630 [Streptomyces sp. SID4946]|nr:MULTISPECIES: hypothetical protein [unclassified Streptomyces]MYQ94957.1 hypothetical protein [Streptomyces sp. SID4946]SCF92666.1 putative polyketide hydroxylase [Streptomyces sp. DconLS]